MNPDLTKLFAGQKVLVFGLGMQGGGEGDVRFLQTLGCKLRITDKKTKSELGSTLARLPADISGTFGGHDQGDIDWADIILVNPGVPLTTPELIYARSLGKSLVSRTALFVKYCGIPVIGVTGTRGKSTTTELIYTLLSRAYPGQIVRGGNIPGISDLELLRDLTGKKYAVLELSSFQLEHFHQAQLSPAFAIITNLYPDHLNRYADMAEYASAKSAICAYQHPGDITLINQENKACQEVAKACTGTLQFFGKGDAPQGAFVHLPGEHNQENMAAVAKLAQVLGLSQELVQEVCEKYPGLPFRLETRATISGVTYVNDTTATTPTATLKAIATITAPTILILGGAEKSLPTTELFEALANIAHIKAIVVLGSVHNKAVQAAIKNTLASKYQGSANTMQEAVALAQTVAKPGYTILLSPGFSSFDLFQNEFDRGQQFNSVVAGLALCS